MTKLNPVVYKLEDRRLSRQLKIEASEAMQMLCMANPLKEVEFLSAKEIEWHKSKHEVKQVVVQD